MKAKQSLENKSFTGKSFSKYNIFKKQMVFRCVPCNTLQVVIKADAVNARIDHTRNRPNKPYEYEVH